MIGELTLKQRYRQHKRCWTCGRYTSDHMANVCEYCLHFPIGSDMRPYPHGTAERARQYGLRKSDMIDHATRHVPSPA